MNRFEQIIHDIKLNGLLFTQFLLMSIDVKVTGKIVVFCRLRITDCLSMSRSVTVLLTL